MTNYGAHCGGQNKYNRTARVCYGTRRQQHDVAQKCICALLRSLLRACRDNVRILARARVYRSKADADTNNHRESISFLCVCVIVRVYIFICMNNSVGDTIDTSRALQSMFLVYRAGRHHRRLRRRCSLDGAPKNYRRSPHVSEGTHEYDTRARACTSLCFCTGTLLALVVVDLRRRV